MQGGKNERSAIGMLPHNFPRITTFLPTCCLKIKNKKTIKIVFLISRSFIFVINGLVTFLINSNFNLQTRKIDTNAVQFSLILITYVHTCYCLGLCPASPNDSAALKCPTWHGLQTMHPGDTWHRHPLISCQVDHC